MITQATPPSGKQDNESALGTADIVTAKVGFYRWKICGLLFFATTLNYMDRQVLGLLKPTLQDPTP